uniref:Uncharacterized protein n=1 Tax=Anopheles maculatus TaxID=74869 RepID=A0A182S9N0_9DIPT
MNALPKLNRLFSNYVYARESTSRFESVSGSSVKLLWGDSAIADSLSKSPLLEHVLSSPSGSGTGRSVELSSSSCRLSGSRYWKVFVPGMRMYWCPLMMVICV